MFNMSYVQKTVRVGFKYTETHRLEDSGFPLLNQIFFQCLVTELICGFRRTDMHF